MRRCLWKPSCTDNLNIKNKFKTHPGFWHCCPLLSAVSTTVRQLWFAYTCLSQGQQRRDLGTHMTEKQVGNVLHQLLLHVFYMEKKSQLRDGTIVSAAAIGFAHIDCDFTSGSLRKTKARPWGKNSMNINPLRKTSGKHKEEWKVKDFVRTCQHLFMELLLLINEAVINYALRCHKTLLQVACFSLSPAWWKQCPHVLQPLPTTGHGR